MSELTFQEAQIEPWPGGKIGLRLIRLLVDWSKAQECQEIHIIATAGIEPEHTDAFVGVWDLKHMAGIMWWSHRLMPTRR